MDFLKTLEKNAEHSHSLVCLGLDPVLERIPLEEKSVEKKITSFFTTILETLAQADALPNAVKPNFAFYAQYGFDGLHALENVVQKAHALNLPVVLDAKRNDIGKTAQAYAKECFGFWNVEAVTVNPLLGSDSLEPFLDWCNEKEKTIFVLNRTSNPGAKEFQDLKLFNGQPLHREISSRILDWNRQTQGKVGAVVGATSVLEFELVAGFFVSRKQKVPLLVPGVGTQGGNASDILQVLKKTNYHLPSVLISSSSATTYAFEKKPGKPFEEAALEAVQELQKETWF